MAHFSLQLTDAGCTAEAEGLCLCRTWERSGSHACRQRESSRVAHPLSTQASGPCTLAYGPTLRSGEEPRGRCWSHAWSHASSVP